MRPRRSSYFFSLRSLTLFSLAPRVKCRLFSLSNSNITTSNETLAYIKQFWFPAASDAQIATIGTLYPDDPSAGSPFGTGIFNQLTPEYKRLAGMFPFSIVWGRVPML
jgi:hypothetical protein